MCWGRIFSEVSKYLAQQVHNALLVSWIWETKLHYLNPLVKDICLPASICSGSDPFLKSALSGYDVLNVTIDPWLHDFHEK